MISLLVTSPLVLEVNDIYHSSHDNISETSVDDRVHDVTLNLVNSRNMADAKERRKLRCEYLKSKRNILCDVSLSSNSTSNCPIDNFSIDESMDTSSELKKHMRKIRNRQSAELSRKRKQDDITLLQQEVKELLSEVRHLKSRLSKYESIADYNMIPMKANVNTCLYSEPAVFDQIFVYS